MSILNTLQNNAFGSIAIPSAKLLIVTCFVAMVYGVVHWRSSFDTLMYCTVLGYLVFLTMLVPTGAVAMTLVFVLSLNFHQSMRVRLQFQRGEERATRRKTLTSLPSLKCKVGPFYYMESKAKLTLADNLVNGVAFTLMH